MRSRSGNGSDSQREMNAADDDWGGLNTLLLAAEFVESQEQEKTQNLIEICEEYPTPEKNNFSTESAASSVTSVRLIQPTSVLSLTAAATTTPKGGVLRAASNETVVGGAAANTPASGAAKSLSSGSVNSPRSVITSVAAPYPSALTNGSSVATASVPPAATMLVQTQSTLPSFSPTPSLTFTFTSQSIANTSSLQKIPSSSAQATIRVPTVTSPRHYSTPLIIQPSTISHSPPPLHPARVLQQQPLSLPPHSAPTISILPGLPQRPFAPDRTAASTSTSPLEPRRKLSNTGTREVHNKLEKNRRAHLKECFELLKSQVPAIQDEKKPSNLTILRTAIRYVQILRRRETELESELEKLAREKIVKQQKLTSLKKELESQWDHIDFSLLLPDTLESAQAAANGGADHHRELRDYEMERDPMTMSDLDDALSQVKSRGETYYGGSISPTGSCSVSPLHISSPNVVTTVSDSLPPQIHIVEAPAVSLEKLSGATVVSPLQFLSTSTIRMITDADQQPIALVHHNAASGGDKLSESATLPKMAVHSGNTFIFSEAYPKVNAAIVSSAGSASASTTTIANAKLSSSAVQYATAGLALPTVTVPHKNVALSVKPGSFTSTSSNGSIVASSVGEKKTSTVLATVPVPSNVGSLVNHSFVVTQPSSGQMLISTTAPHLPSNIMPAPPPLLKTVSRLQPINGHQLVMKPATTAVVVVSSSTAASK